MTRPIVLDSSVAIAIVRDEPEAATARDLLDRWEREHVRLIVPSHFWLEVVNVLIRRHRWANESVLEAIHILDQNQFQTIHLERPMLLLAMDRAQRFGLTSYDANYLALAESVNGDLFTFDTALRISAGERAISWGRSRLSETPAVYEHDVTWPDYSGASAYLAQLRADARAGVS